ncbi:MORC family CW-type zinc finger protein 3-like [Myxocyprinus asiaticus]|uniref:MORC family CW-type zinc finger protein 3-like n=1 Tax=Myxocyprinus asiaticus TaxID=70543 RepID=UPI002222A185|nr:MORC family CW-type zinc finger protein 3-like [Myxocyprinus asiaticus]
MMARLSEHGIRLSSMSPSYLESNSTSHTWPFSAVAELIDNASDPGVTAKNIWIDVVKVRDQLCLSFMDNGSGMTPNKLHKMLSFGFTEKGSGKSSHQPIGVYGNGFKSGSMRLGRDALIFTKNGGCQSVGMLSQSFLQAIKAQAVIVPIAPFNQQTKTLVVTEDSEASLRAILKYSLFQNVSELQEQLDSLQGKKGTKILIWNIRRNKDGKPEFDFDTDAEDIRLPEIQSEEAQGKLRRDYYKHRRDSHIPEIEYSLRAYLSILYLKPRTQIILRQKKVQTKLVAKSLSMIENDVYKPHFINERVKITFGFNRKNKELFGIMMYHKNRLIKAYEKVGCQIKSSGLRSGVGVIGVIECNFLKPAHNKQDFEYTKEYRLTLAALGLKLNDYWREKKEKKAKEREIQALERKNKEGDTEEEEEEDEEEEVDVSWIQCEECLKWRGVATHLFAGKVPDPFRCSMHPIAHLRSCLVPENTEEDADVTPSYEKTLKKQENASVKRRGRSLEMSKSPVRPLCRGLSDPASDTKQDEVMVTMAIDSHYTDEDGVNVAATDEESLPSPRKRRKETCSHVEKGNKSPNRAGTPELLLEGDTETTDQINETETNSTTTSPLDMLVLEDNIQPEPSVLESPVEPQISQGPPQPKDQPRIPPHPLSPHTSMTMAQTVVVTPLSRSGFQPISPLPTDGSDRTALTQRLAQLEREAKRLKRILGALEPMTEVAMVTEGEVGGPSDATTNGRLAQNGDSVSCDQNVERLTPMTNESRGEELSVCLKSEEQANRPPVQRGSTPPVQQGAETRPKDELYWSKTLMKLQSENQALSDDLNKLRTERDQLLNQVRQTERETHERRDQSTNTSSHTYNSSVTLERLRSIRRNVVALLSSILPNLDMQGISYDTIDVDSILQQIIQANNL